MVSKVMTDSKKIGKSRLRFFGLFESKFYLCQIQGTWEFIQRLQIIVIGRATTSAPALKNLPGRLSVTAAFVVSISLNILSK